MITKKSLLVIILLSALFQGYSQRFYLTGGIGGMYYNGDLRETGLPDLKTLHFSYGIGLDYELNRKFNLSYQFVKGMVSGNDAFSSSEDRNRRNLSFESKISEHSLRLQFKAFSLGKRKRLFARTFIGLGVFKFNPYYNSPSGTIYLQPLGTEGQNSTSGNYPTPYKLTQINTPLGVNLNYRITSRIAVYSELTYHRTFTDYLDDVSGEYPELAYFETVPDPQQSFAASFRGNTSQYPAGKMRGNPNLNDAFIDILFGVRFSLGKKTNLSKRVEDPYGCPSF